MRHLSSGLLILLCVVPCAAPRTAHAGDGPRATQNGDVNGDDRVDLSDAVSILLFLFAGGEEPVEFDCGSPLEFPPDTIFVSPTGIDTVERGTREEPVRSIQFGIDLAVSRGFTNVAVATGYYPGSLSMAEGVNVRGGYDAAFALRDVWGLAAVVRPAPGEMIDYTVACFSIDAPTVLEGLVIDGPKQTAPGRNSYGVYIRDSTSALTVASNQIFGGWGAGGPSGQDGNSGRDGPDGASGQDGGAFPGPNIGGTGGVLENGGTISEGGSGGTAIDPVFDPDPNHDTCPEVGSGGDGTPAGAGGSGGEGGCVGAFSDGPTGNNPALYLPTSRPLDGSPGQNGAGGGDGDGGSGGIAGGSISLDGNWIAAAGSNGSPGLHGQGGGGGGAAGGAEDLSLRMDIGDVVGASGGGGGAGGQGGEGGSGGMGGGGSFGIFVYCTTDVPSLPLITENKIFLGRGGSGGPGGNGGVGGSHGRGGYGGSHADPYSWEGMGAGRGGDGGNGGAGGHGGGGGGGAGGMTCGIAAALRTGVFPTWESDNAIDVSPGLAGSGGTGGLSLRNPGDTGQVGSIAAVKYYVLPAR